MTGRFGADGVFADHTGDTIASPLHSRISVTLAVFFLHLETRRVTLAGITQHPTEEWMVQMARRAVDHLERPYQGKGNHQLLFP